MPADLADALTIAWDAFCAAARDDLTSWEVASAAAEVQPEPPLAGAGVFWYFGVVVLATSGSACLGRSEFKE